VLWLALGAIQPGSALAQRIPFPTPIPPEVGTVGTVPASPALPGPANAPIGTPGVTPSIITPGAAPPGTVVGPPLAPPSLALGSPSVLSPGAGAAFQGTIQPPPSWDPYATPDVGPSPLLPADPYLPWGNPFGSTSPMIKLMREIRLDHHWLADSGSEGLGVNETETSVTFAFPFLYNQQTPLLVTPGFAMRLWDGPVTTPTSPVDMPGQTFDAYLDAAWNPQLAARLSAELGARVGVYSDFSKVATESLRIQGRGLVSMAFSPSFQVKAGAIYLNRNHVKLLPAGGVVWTPNTDTRFDIIFPYPKLAKRITLVGQTEWWYYLRGEYGGGAWTVKRGTGPRRGLLDSVDYNDLRVALGVDFRRNPGWRGFFEVGLAFNRELLYFAEDNPAIPEPMSRFKPSDTVFLGGGIAY